MEVAQRLLECNNTKEVVELVDSQAKANLREWKRGLLEEALEGLVDKHRGQKWLKLRERKPTPWIGVKCGPRESNQVKRNGHYWRYPVISEGTICLRIPQLECLTCGKEVALNVLLLPKRKRYWIELDRKITELYLSGASYRQVKAILAGNGMGLWFDKLMAALPKDGKQSYISWTGRSPQGAIS